jgi:hypothetical protein
METYVTINRQNLAVGDGMVIVACVAGKFVRDWKTQADITDADLILLKEKYKKINTPLKSLRNRLIKLGL